MTDLPDIDFTTNLFKFLDFVIGEHECVSFPKQFIEQLEVIEIKLRKSKTLLYHIQKPSDLYPDIELPILWKYPAWVNDSDRRQKRREQSDLERREKFAFDDNVKIVAKAYRLTTDCDIEYSMSAAYNLVKKKKWSACLALGVKEIKNAEDYKQ